MKVSRCVCDQAWVGSGLRVGRPARQLGERNPAVAMSLEPLRMVTKARERSVCEDVGRGH